MAKRIKEVTRDFLKAVPLPQQTSSYTVISHESVMNYVFAELANHGFVVVSEEYRCTHDGMIAQGIYKLQYNSDQEMSLMFAWSNSYNKQLKFKCITGGYVEENKTVMVCGEIGSWTRKHTGTADADAIAMIKNQISNAQMYYNNLVADKEAMKLIPLSTKRQAEILGVLFAEHEVLTTEQASIVRAQMDKPSFFYNGGKHTLWSFYNHVTVALQQSHPRSWMEDQRILHWFITQEYDLTATAPDLTPDEDLSTPVDMLANNYGEPENQTNLLVQIAEVTGDESVLEPQLSDNQAVQEEVEIDTVLHQSEEIIEEAIEDDTDEVPWHNDEVVTYTDPAGNTFEAPVVVDDFITDEEEDAIMEQILVPIPPCAAHDSETEKDLEEEIRETEVTNFFEEVAPIPSLTPTPEEHVMFEAEEAQRLANEPEEANLDLTENVVQVSNNDDADFDLDFGSDNPEDEEVDNTPDFF